MGANGGSTRVPGAKKMIFSKVVPRPLGMLKQVVLAHFEPVATGFGSWKIPKCLEKGPFWDQKWVKNGSKRRFSKSDLGPFGMLKHVFLARFEPVLKEFSPFHHMYAPLCALRTYLRAVWWSHLELGEGCRLEDIYIYIYIYGICGLKYLPGCRVTGWALGRKEGPPPPPPPHFGVRKHKKTTTTCFRSELDGY